MLLVVGALAIALFLAAEHRIAGAPGLPLDDGWIHLRLARNLATGGGLAINPGQPVAGLDGPAVECGLAGLLVVGMPGLAAAKTLGLACWMGTGLVTRRLAGAVGLGARWAWAAGLAVVLLSRLVWGALSGMEVPLATLTVAAGAWAIAVDRPALGAAALALATLARPEAGLLVGLHVLGAGRWREALRRAAVAAAIVAPAAVFNLVAGGRLVPATAAAKVEGGLLGRTEGLANAWAVAGRRRRPSSASGSRSCTRTTSCCRPSCWSVSSRVGLAVSAGWRSRWSSTRWRWRWSRPYRGPGFQTGRYSAHLLPLAVVVALTGLGRLLPWLATRPGRVAAASLLLAGLVLRLPGEADAYAWGVQNINAMQVALGRWVAARTPPDTLIALNDVGALSYFGQRRVIDLMGLATPEILPYRRQGPDGVLRYLRRAAPSISSSSPTGFPSSPRGPISSGPSPR